METLMELEIRRTKILHKMKTTQSKAILQDLEIELSNVNDKIESRYMF
jgi:hypothetical protein